MSKKNWVQDFLGQTKFWAKKYFGKKNRVPKYLDRISLVKIGLETAEIFIYGQMSSLQLKSVQDGPRSLSLKFGQNLVSNS